MKRIIVSLLVSFGILTGLVGSAGAVNPDYCGSDPWSVSYRAVYQYPTGSYWASQISRYPAYYAAYNSYYLNAYGC